MLTRAQRRVGRIVLELVQGYGSVLAGGAAMNEAGLIDRPTNDLDFFTNNLKVELSEITAQVTTALADAGVEVTVMRSSPQFVRLLVNAGRRNTFELDFGFDAFQWQPVMGSIGPRLSDKELAVNKVLAAFGRVVPRDLMDLEALDKRFQWEELFSGAKEKDPGFDLGVLAEMLTLNINSDEWPATEEAERTRAFGKHVIQDIIPMFQQPEAAPKRRKPRGFGK